VSRLARGLALGTARALGGAAHAQDAAKEIQRYREMVAEGSPAELFLPGGSLLGDWKRGEAVAQDGRGLTWNDKPGHSLCSQMPRFGPSGTLSAEQIRDLVGLLLDPASPVNQ
jgi:hypothetical protein